MSHPSSLLPVAPLPTGTLTFLFTDIEGSTQLWEQHPHAMPTALERHHAILRQVIESHGGVVFKTVGDGVHAVFAHAAAALAAALGAQRILYAEPWHETGALRVRMALHTGAAELRAGDYFGPPLNRVARILGLGHGGQVLLSHTTSDLVADDLPEQIALQALGEYQLKDLTRPEQIFQLVCPDLPSAFPPLRTVVTTPTPTAAPPAQLLTTKLYVPSARSNLVPRRHLIDRLHAGLAGKLTLIAAPAGFGKTTLVSAWLTKLRIENEELRQPGRDDDSQFSNAQRAPDSQFKVAWVALDKGDNDPIRFWSYVIAALDLVQAGVFSGALGQLQSPQPPPIKDILTTLLNALSSLTADVVLMLDDYHLIDTPAIHQSLAFLLDHLPRRLHLVLASRADPPLPLSRLRARGELNELRAVDLRFTPEEAAAFLTAALGVRLSSDAVAALEERTEGWIAGLQFAALAMRDRRDHAGFIAAFTGSNRFVMDYLAEEVLNQLPHHLHTFLLDTAILDRLCGSLCDAVLGIENAELKIEKAITRQSSSQFSIFNSQFGEAYSQLILDQLERANLFLVPLDDDRHWYRFHPLFAEVLRSRLSGGASAAHVATLHQRASIWFEQHGLGVEAITHALATNEHERTARLIEQWAWPVVYRGQIHTALGWFNTLPVAFIHTHPSLCVLHAQMLMHTDRLDAAESRLQEAEQALLPDTPDELARSIRGRVLTTRANISFYQGNLPRSVVIGQQALEIFPEIVSFSRPAASAFAAHSFLVTGAVTPAIERLVAAVAPAAHAAGNRFVQLRGYTLLAELEVLQGRLKAAAATYREAAQLAPEPAVLASMIGSPAYYFGLGDLYREWNDLDSAEQLLTEGMHRAIGAVTANAVYLRQGCFALARLQHARGDHAAALAALKLLADLGRQRGFDPLVLAQGLAVRARLAVAEGQLETAIRWADTSGVCADDAPSFPRELEHLTLARVLIAQGRGDPQAPFLHEAQHLLDRLLAAADDGARMRSVIEIVLLRALALAAQGDAIGALTTLERALTLAAPEGYIRLFVDEGAPMRLLIEDCKLQITKRIGSAGSRDGQHVLTYADTLLAAFGELRIENEELRIAPILSSSFSILNSQFLMEPLSERELEVLRLIGAGRSNQAIADTLIIAVSTVKRHINNIYGKLAVQSRTQALARARELKLI
jgi:LuxR family transcriptional regulator, maltose regulon positive regulatory protein